MEERQLRLGDVLDDYCPRERRITNHLIVAMIENSVKQTRCTTCDAEHVYKSAKLPPKRQKKDAPAALYEQVLAARSEAEKAVDSDGRAPEPAMDSATSPSPTSGPAREVDAAGTSLLNAETASTPEDGPVRRPLIRATLPRLEGQAPLRPAPQFTIRQSSARHARVRETDPRALMRRGGPLGNGGRPPAGGGRPHTGGRPGRPGARGETRPPVFTQAPRQRTLDRQVPGRHARAAQPARHGKKRSK